MAQLRQSFNSSAISEATYDTEEQTLEITFANGLGYTYENVPVEVWEGLTVARSAGNYFFTKIKDRY